VLIVLAASVLVVNAVEDAAGVTELAKEDAFLKAELGEAAGEAAAAKAKTIYFTGTGGDDTNPAEGVNNAGDTAASTEADMNAGEGPGYWKRIANFPGPKFGLPGYKESHDWETDWDSISPLVFDRRFYRALMSNTPAAAKGLSEEDLKTHFEALVMSRSPTAGMVQGATSGCPVGTIWFDANAFYEYYKTEVTSFTMSDVTCEQVFKHYLTAFIYGDSDYADGTTQDQAFIAKTVSKHETSNAAFPQVGTRLFTPVNARSDTPHAHSEAIIHVGQSQYFTAATDWRSDNTFSAARHITMAFWMVVAPQSIAPNAEVFAFGAKNTNNYLRTGFGCLGADLAATDNNCYWIFVMKADTKEYFHTYETSNFPKLRTAFGAVRWAQVTIMLTTVTPGYVHDGQTSTCATNSAIPGDPCDAIFELYVDKNQIEVVDWTHGTDTSRSKTDWNSKIEDVWSTGKISGQTIGGTDAVKERFFVSPAISCTKGANQCGDVNENALTFEFPWYGAYLNGIYICDMVNLPSGNGGFGVKERRELAVDAFFMNMKDTFPAACIIATLSTSSPAVTNDQDSYDSSDAGLADALTPAPTARL
jgi:hypothetical protein